MFPAQTLSSARRPFRLTSARSARRWAGWFVFAWLAMWVSAVLLPCGEVAAAMAAHEQATDPVCGQSGNGKIPHTGGDKKDHKPCFSVSAPAQTSAARPVPTGGHPVTPVAIVSASSYVLPSRPGLSLPVAYRAAPPPPAAFLRNPRLLI